MNFNPNTIEGTLANEIFETIKYFDWTPSLTVWDAIVSLSLVQSVLLGLYDPNDEFDEGKEE